jgi:subtilisin family serine protease
MDPSRCSSVAPDRSQALFFGCRTGRNIRVAVLDSGVHTSHPHVGVITDGIAISPDGQLNGDYIDRIGHGTAVASVIREKAPDAELVAVKIFSRSLVTDATTLVRATEWAIGNGARVINLSLGTANPQHALDFAEAIEYARARNAVIVAARGSGAETWFPGSLTGVLPVLLNWECPRDEYRIELLPDLTVAFGASGYPRDIPGVPRERNLKGLSFAVANMTGFVARALEGAPDATLEDLFEVLRRSACR